MLQLENLIIKDCTEMIEKQRQEPQICSPKPLQVFQENHEKLLKCLEVLLGLKYNTHRKLCVFKGLLSAIHCALF